MAVAPILALESPWSRTFDSPALEWRRLFSEFLGTFFLVLGVILYMGAVSGAHLNPAVTLSFALRGDFPWRRVPGYIVTQLIAASAAVLLLRVVFGDVGGLGATLPGQGFTDLQAVTVELLLTVGLVSTILGTASTAQNVGPLSAIAVGGYIVLAGLWSSPVSGASMNPARSFGPALITGDFSSYWVYLVGPVLGGAIAVGLAFVLRGRGGDAGGRAAARGGLTAVIPGPRHTSPPPSSDRAGESSQPTG